MKTKTNWFAMAVAWTWVGIPLAWGVLSTLKKAAALFN
jgi:hypothetical protein